MPLKLTRPASNESRVNFPLALIVLTLALLAAFIFYRLETFPARTAGQTLAGLERVARAASDQFVRLTHLQPQVTVNNRIYLEQTSSIAQLAVLERRVEVEHEMLHSWAGSTKRIKLQGTFAVKAGFDLQKKFNVAVNPAEVTITLPHAEILSVEEQNVEVQAFENGLWNRISPNDVEQEFALLPQLAREKSAALPAEAEKIFSGELQEKIRLEKPVRVAFPTALPAG